MLLKSFDVYNVLDNAMECLQIADVLLGKAIADVLFGKADVSDCLS